MRDLHSLQTHVCNANKTFLPNMEFSTVCNDTRKWKNRTHASFVLRRNACPSNIHVTLKVCKNLSIKETCRSRTEYTSCNFLETTEQHIHFIHYRVYLFIQGFVSSSRNFNLLFY